MNKAKRKNILIDLSDLKHPNCGFGQIAINYSKRFANFIIRKTKCSPLFKRSDISYKTKRPPKNNFPKYSRGSKKSTGKFCFSQCFFL